MGGLHFIGVVTSDTAPVGRYVHAQTAADGRLLLKDIGYGLERAVAMPHAEAVAPPLHCNRPAATPVAKRKCL